MQPMSDFHAGDQFRFWDHAWTVVDDTTSLYLLKRDDGKELVINSHKYGVHPLSSLSKDNQGKPAEKEIREKLDKAIENFNSPENVKAARALERRVHRYSAEDLKRRMTI